MKPQELQQSIGKVRACPATPRQLELLCMLYAADLRELLPKDIMPVMRISRLSVASHVGELIYKGLAVLVPKKPGEGDRRVKLTCEGAAVVEAAL